MGPHLVLSFFVINIFGKSEMQILVIFQLCPQSVEKCFFAYDFTGEKLQSLDFWPI